MGWGARLGFGCNIGAFVGGVASGSLHGWIWFSAGAARLPDRHPPAAAVRSVAGSSTMRRVYIVVVLIGVAAILVDHLLEPVERPCRVAGRFRRRLRALRRAVSVESNRPHLRSIASDASRMPMRAASHLSG